MKKRTLSQSASTTPTHSKTVNTSNTNSQNYLHMLKQSSTAYKATKATGSMKPENLSSLHKTSTLQTPFSSKLDLNFTNNMKPNLLFASMTPTAKSQKKMHSSIAVDLRTNPHYESQKTDSKMPTVPRNSSEPRLKGLVLKQFEFSDRKQQNRSANLTEEPLNSDNADEIASYNSHRNESQRDKVSSDSPKAGAMSNEKIREQVHVALLGNFEAYGANKPSQFVPRKQSQSTNSEILNESFDTYKDYKNLSEESESRGEERCMNHPNKRAKYFTTTSEDELQTRYNLCSKCAVTLADKGAKVKEIINSEEELRKSEIEAFLIKLSHTRKHSNSINESISLKKSDFIDFFNKQNEKAETIAAVLQKIINEELNNVKKCFELQKNQIIAAVELFEQQLQAGFKEVEEMQSDIQRNLDNILKHIELTPFKKIIESYYHRLYDIDQQLEGVRGQKIEVGKMSSVKSKNLQELKQQMHVFFELRGLKTSILKKD